MICKRYPYYCLSLLLLCLINTNSYGQTLKEFFKDKNVPLTYLGVDFSSATIEGEPAAKELHDKYESINSVIVTEVKKYDVGGTFRRSSSTNDLDMITRLNDGSTVKKTNNIDDLEKNMLKPDDIKNHVKAYDLSGKKGVGLVFIIDGMSKTRKESTMYVTLIDLAKKKVLLAERLTGSTGGFGLRNYWLSPVYKVLNDIDKHKYDDWADDAEKAPEEKVVVEEPKKAAPVAPATPAAKEPKAKKVKKA
jgi:hypothetical protein